MKMAKTRGKSAVFLAKLQNIEPRILQTWIHSLISLSIVWGLAHTAIKMWTAEIDFTKDKQFKQGYENKECLLSIWVTIFQIIYFSAYSVIDLIAIYGKQSEKALKTRKTLHNIAGFILFSIVFPLSAVTSTLFWTLYYWDPESMYPKQMDEVIPQYMNHMVHTYPAPVSVLYMLTDVTKEPPKSKTLPALISFMVLYTLVFFQVHKWKGVWIYPIFENLTSSQIKGILVSSVIASLIYYFLGYCLYDIIKGLRSNITSNSNKTRHALNFKKKKS